MAATAGPDIIEDGIVFYYDTGNFPKGWGLTQLVPNSTFVNGGTRPTDHGCYTSGYYLGPYTSSFMTGGTLQFTGGDLSNYYTTNPEYRGWDQGSLGNTGGNWMYYVVLPPDLNSGEDYIVETRARFVYVSKTGNGSANPRFQIGRGYYERFGINYNDLGTEFKTLKFLINGGQTAAANEYFTFGCTSADAMVELDYLNLYKVEKATGLKDLTGNSTINLTNVSFNGNGEVVFDGTNDYINVPYNSTQNLTNQGTVSVWIYPFSTTQGSYAGLVAQCTGGSVNTQAYQLSWRQISGALYGAICNGSGTYNEIYGTLPTVANTWYNIVFTWNGSQLNMYNNGTLIGTTTQTINNQVLTTDLTIGGYTYKGAGGSGEYFNGKIANVEIYDRGLTTSEVLTNYNALKTRFGI
jgi:hypothetical protein